MSILTLPSIGLGTNYIGGHNLFPQADEKVGRTIVEQALHSGFTFFDTAYIYGLGRSEEIIGEVLAATKQRSNVLLATKAAHVQGEKGITIENHPQFLTEEVEKALKRLQTDVIDLFYIHFPDDHTPKAEAVGALQRLKEQGKIRAIGVSNFSIEQLKEANANGYVDYVQGEFNLLNRSVETTFFPYLQQENIDFIPYFPLASGLLAGKYSADMVFTDGRKNKSHFQGQPFIDNLHKVEQLKPLATKYNTSIANIVLSYYTTIPTIASVIPGAKRPEQVIDNAQAAHITLTPAECAFIETTFQ